MRRVGYVHLIANKLEWESCFIKLSTSVIFAEFFGEAYFWSTFMRRNENFKHRVT